MKTSFLLLFLSVLIFSNCTLEDRLERREDRIVGTWIFDRAHFDEDGDLFCDNVIDDFRGDRVTFFPNFTVTYDDANGNFFEGEWLMSAIRNTGDDEDDVEFLLDVDFFDINDLPSFTWIATVTRLNQNRLHLHVQERSGRFIFKFRRVD